MTEPTDAELIAELEAAGVSFLAFLGGLSGAKKVWTTSGSQDAKKIAAGMRAAIAKWGTPPAVAGEPIGYCHEIKWRAHQSEQVQKITRKAQPEYGYTQALYTTPQPTQPQAGAVPQCWCLTCRPMRLEDPYSMRMALCPTCGNKRCPKANDHRNECSGSNEPGQPGSAYSGGIKGGRHGTDN